MCKIHIFLQRVHCVEVKSAVDVEMFTALPDSMKFDTIPGTLMCKIHIFCNVCIV